jgi:peptide subunit release factor 1 (eRF1)
MLGSKMKARCPVMLMLSRYGFIIMDGNGSLFGTLCGNTREILHKFQVCMYAHPAARWGCRSSVGYGTQGPWAPAGVKALLQVTPSN